MLSTQFVLSIYQISAKRGHDSKFVVETNIKALLPKSSQSQIAKLKNRGQITRPRVKYRVEYRGEYQLLANFFSIKNYLTMTHKCLKTQITQFDSTQLN